MERVECVRVFEGFKKPALRRNVVVVLDLVIGFGRHCTIVNSSTRTS
jgi:hypothetical protein